jgi:hypothetical protein
MKMRDLRKLALLPVLFLAPLCAQPPQGGPKNLKVLKPDQVRPLMRTFTAGLGVKCDFCHVEGDFASDDKAQKATARMMISMTQQINKNFDGKERVACYTCHRGETEPKAAAPAGF